MWKHFKNSKTAIVYQSVGNVIVVDDIFLHNANYPLEHEYHAKREAQRLNGNGTEINWPKLEDLSKDLASTLI